MPRSTRVEVPPEAHPQMVAALRRAFVLAGAKTLVMGLWKAPDEQTQE